MTLSELRFLIRCDLYRYHGRTDVKVFLKSMLGEPGFKYSFWMRICAYLRDKGPASVGLYYWARLVLRHYKYKYGISIPHTAQIGHGLHIFHFGGIFVNRHAIIGTNCVICQGVTIGYRFRGERLGCPTIGNNVFIGPGAVIIGNIRVGNRVAIGANCVVTEDVPEDGVIIGVPGKVISYEGSEGYVWNAGD